jgi:polyisoprenoid-binding protein YceI
MAGFGQPLDSGLLPPPGTYLLRPGWCVVELSSRVFGWPVIRGRFQANWGVFLIGDNDDDHVLTAEVAADSLRTNIPLLRGVLTGEGGLCADDFPTIRLNGTTLTDEGPPILAVHGKLEVRGVLVDLTLRGRLVFVDDETVVYWAKGVLPAPQTIPKELGFLPRQLVRRPITIEVAVEFAEWTDA